MSSLLEAKKRNRFAGVYEEADQLSQSVTTESQEKAETHTSKEVFNEIESVKALENKGESTNEPKAVPSFAENVAEAEKVKSSKINTSKDVQKPAKAVAKQPEEDEFKNLKKSKKKSKHWNLLLDWEVSEKIEEIYQQYNNDESGLSYSRIVNQKLRNAFGLDMK